MMSARSARRFSGLLLPAVLSCPLLLASMAFAADVSFPANPQTKAECDGPAAQMLAMEKNESALATKASREMDALPYEALVCRGNECVRPTTDPIRNRLLAESRMHRDESTRLGKERAELERACRTAAAENEKAKQDETNAIAAKLRELKESYEDAKRAYETAKDLYLKPPAELAQDAVNRATGGAADDAVAGAYRRRNDAYSASLEAAMNDAKRKTVDMVRRSDLVAEIQNAAFNQVKSQVHQLRGDWNQLEANIQGFLNSPSPAPSSPPVAASPPAEPAGNSVTSFFRNAVRGVSERVREVTGAMQASVDKPASETAPNPAPSPAQSPTSTPAVAARQLTPAEQCVATENNCQKGCVAIGAAGGLLSLFSNSAAGAGATADQMQKCSDRCTATKSSCDQQVAAAEQEKQQAIDAAQRPPSAQRVAVSNNAGAQGALDPQVCSAEIERNISLSEEHWRLIKAKQVNTYPAQIRKEVAGLLEEDCSQQEAMRANVERNEKVIRDHDIPILEREQQRKNSDPFKAEAVLSARQSIARAQVYVCVQRARAAQCDSLNAAAARVPTAGGKTGLPFAECQRQENASDIGRKLTALPDSNTNLKTRGIIVASDFMIKTYSQCLPDQRAQQMVNQYRTTRAQTLRTCQQVSSSDNCLVSPF
jgi:hypothetical protein